MQQANKIISDPSHIMHGEYELLPLGRRFRVPHCRLNRFKNSFVPVSIKLVNGIRLDQSSDDLHLVVGYRLAF